MAGDLHSLQLCLAKQFENRGSFFIGLFPPAAKEWSLKQASYL